MGDEYDHGYHNNNILNEEIIPNQWIKVIIKSFYKTKGPRSEMTNTAGIFLTNFMNNMFENSEKMFNAIKMLLCQNGGQKGRS